MDSDEPPTSTNTKDIQESVSFLILLLKMGAVFDIDVAKSHVICHLDTHSNLDLTTKLELCHHFQIISWLSPTFKAFVSQPIKSFNLLGLGQIPTHILHALIQVKHWIITHRLTLAAITPPAIAGFSCLTPAICAFKWESMWREGPAEMLHHPDIFYAGHDILVKLISADLSPICQNCGEMSIFNVQDSRSLVMEEIFIDEILGELRTWLMNQ
jgi:hypothetical protein